MLIIKKQYYSISDTGRLVLQIYLEIKFLIEEIKFLIVET